MTAPDSPALDPDAILAALDRHRVAFVLVGGLASTAHGSTRVTQDLDLCPAWDHENLDRLAAALRDLQAELKIGDGSIDTLTVAIDGHTIANLEIGNWRTIAGDVDVLLGIPRESRLRLARYDELAARATVFTVAGRPIPVASLDDLIRSKETADRPKDRDALPELRELRDRARGHETDLPDLGFER